MEEWPIWRVWKQGNESLWDLRHKYVYEDILKMNAVLDMEDDFKLAYENRPTNAPE